METLHTLIQKIALQNHSKILYKCIQSVDKDFRLPIQTPMQTCYIRTQNLSAHLYTELLTLYSK